MYHMADKFGLSFNRERVGTLLDVGRGRTPGFKHNEALYATCGLDCANYMCSASLGWLSFCTGGFVQHKRTATSASDLCTATHSSLSPSSYYYYSSPNIRRMFRTLTTAVLLTSASAFSPAGRMVSRGLAMAVIKEGDKIPSVVFKARVRDESIGGSNPFTWKDVTSDSLFKGKRAVVFSLPGAFTPTCSSTHLPGYEKVYEEMKKLGVDDVYCLSVNDAFVMRQWGISQGLEKEDKDATNPLNPGNFKKVKLLPDGAALFTRGMGLNVVWEKERGFGERSWRYSAVINDGKVEKLFVEGGSPKEDYGPDPFEVSDATTMLNYLKSKK